MIDSGALAAIRAGRAGVHVVHDGRVFEATGVANVARDELTLLAVRHLNGEDAGSIPASETTALERTYEPMED